MEGQQGAIKFVTSAVVTFVVSHCVMAFLIDPGMFLSMVRTLTKKAGGHILWTGYLYQAYHQEEVFVKEHVKSANFVMHWELEEWAECAQAFQDDILPLYEPLEFGLLNDDSVREDYFWYGHECMGNNGDFDQAIASLNRLPPLSERQTQVRQNMVQATELYQAIKVNRTRETDIAVAFLQDERIFAASGVPKNNKKKKNPFVYFRQGRVLLLMGIFWLFRQTTRESGMFAALLSMVLLSATVLIFLLLGVWWSLLLIMIVSRVRLWSSLSSILQGRGGWQRRVLFVVVGAGCSLNLWYHSMPIPSRHLASGEAFVSSNALERARAVFVQYPYHPWDMVNHAGYHIIVLLMHQQSLKCHLSQYWMENHDPRRIEHCQNTNRAAKAAFDILQAQQDATEEEKELVHQDLDGWLTNSLFPSGAVGNSVEDRNKIRIDAGVPVPPVSPMIDQLKLVPPLLRMLARQLAGSLLWTGFFYHGVEAEDDFSVELIGRSASFTFHHLLEDWGECAKAFKQDVLPRHNLTRGLEDQAFFGVTFGAGLDCLIGNGEYDFLSTLLRLVQPLSEKQRNTQQLFLNVAEHGKQVLAEKKHGIDLAVKFLENKLLASGVANHLAFIRYGRILLLMVFGFLLRGQMKQSSSIARGLFKIVLLVAVALASLRSPVGVPIVAVLTLFIMCGWKQGLTGLVLWGGLWLQIHISSMSFSSRRMWVGQQAILKHELERARAQFVKYPYNLQDMHDETGTLLVLSCIGELSGKCLAAASAMQAGRQSTDCANAKAAAQAAFAICNGRDDEWATLCHTELSGWLIHFEEAPAHIRDIVERNRFQIERGVVSSSAKNQQQDGLLVNGEL